MKQLQNIIHGNPAAQKYLHDEDFRASASLAISFALNLLYAAWEIICGVYYGSYWFITLGFYYILLMSARLWYFAAAFKFCFIRYSCAGSKG